MVEALEERKLFNITGYDLDGPGSIQEGQPAQFYVYASTDHDYVWGTQVHGYLDWGDGTPGEYLNWASSTGQDLYHVFTKANSNPFTQTLTVWDDAGDGTTYNWTSSTQQTQTTTFIMDAPLLQTDPQLATFDDNAIANDEPGARDDIPVAQFADTNPYATTDDFLVTSINWGDGTTSSGGWIEKGGNGNFQVMGFHDYGGPNPATSATGDGTYAITANVMDMNAANGSSGQPVQAKGTGNVVNYPPFLNATWKQGNPDGQTNNTYQRQIGASMRLLLMLVCVLGFILSVAAWTATQWITIYFPVATVTMGGIYPFSYTILERPGEPHRRWIVQDATITQPLRKDLFPAIRINTGSDGSIPFWFIPYWLFGAASLVGMVGLHWLGVWRRRNREEGRGFAVQT